MKMLFVFLAMTISGVSHAKTCQKVIDDFRVTNPFMNALHQAGVVFEEEASTRRFKLGTVHCTETNLRMKQSEFPLGSEFLKKHECDLYPNDMTIDDTGMWTITGSAATVMWMTLSSLDVFGTVAGSETYLGTRNIECVADKTGKRVCVMDASCD